MKLIWKARCFNLPYLQIVNSGEKSNTRKQDIYLQLEKQRVTSRLMNRFYMFAVKEFDSSNIIDTMEKNKWKETPFPPSSKTKLNTFK